MIPCGSGAKITSQDLLGSLQRCQVIDIHPLGVHLKSTGNHTPFVGGPTGAEYYPGALAGRFSQVPWPPSICSWASPPQINPKDHLHDCTLARTHQRITNMLSLPIYNHRKSEAPRHHCFTFPCYVNIIGVSNASFSFGQACSS